MSSRLRQTDNKDIGQYERLTRLCHELSVRTNIKRRAINAEVEAVYKPLQEVRTIIADLRGGPTIEFPPLIRAPIKIFGTERTREDRRPIFSIYDARVACENLHKILKTKIQEKDVPSAQLQALRQALQRLRVAFVGLPLSDDYCLTEDLANIWTCWSCLGHRPRHNFDHIERCPECNLMWHDKASCAQFLADVQALTEKREADKIAAETTSAGSKKRSSDDAPTSSAATVVDVLYGQEAAGSSREDGDARRVSKKTRSEPGVGAGWIDSPTDHA